MAGVTGTLCPSEAVPLIQIKGTAEGQKERPLLSVGRGLVTAMEDARRGVTHVSSAPWTPESMISVSVCVCVFPQFLTRHDEQRLAPCSQLNTIDSFESCLRRS